MKKKECYECDTSFNYGVWFGVLLMLVLMISIGVMLFRGGDDLVDVEEFGKIICEEKGLEYHSREYNFELMGNSLIPIIKCINGSRKSIIDGVVVEIGV